MQRPFLKILSLLLLLSAYHIPPSVAQISGHRLNTADSLFQAKRYTQSLEHYDEILRQRQYTPAMLLKMAYVHEGLNQIGPAMYYLNLYQIATNDESVTAKMDELATKYNLEGYETTDADRFWSFYIDNHFWITLTLAALTILLVSVMYHTRTKLHTRPIASGIAVVALVVVMIVHQQYGKERTRAIIAEATTYVMDGPSAGASVIDVVKDGHRVEVIGKKDVWMKIRWDDEVAYVKEKAVKAVRL